MVYHFCRVSLCCCIFCCIFMFYGRQGTYKNHHTYHKEKGMELLLLWPFFTFFPPGRANRVAPFPLDRNVNENLQRAISYITLHITLEILFSHICELLTDCPNLILFLFFQASSFISTNGKDFLCRHFTCNALSQTFSSNNTFLQTIFCMTQKGGSLFVAANNSLT